MGRLEIPFYDNRRSQLEDDPLLVEVERVYCFDFASFSEEHWHYLRDVYATLPEFRGFDEDGPMWFGVNEQVIPFLWASIEPPGLQVCGILRSEQWEDWDKAFRASVAGLPFREAAR
jgi:hypothetical protein